MYQYNLSKSELIKSKKNDIITKIEKAKGMALPERVISEEICTSTIFNPFASKTAYLSPLFKNTPEMAVDVKQDAKDVIYGFCNEYGIYIHDSFWSLGNLSRKTVLAINPYGTSGDSLIGTDEEKDKYRLIEEIEYNILCFEQYREYFEALDSLPFAECIVNNSGTMHDEDIDVKISVSQGFILQNKDIPVPGAFIIDDINESNFTENYFCGKATVKVDPYTEYPADFHFEIPDISLPFQRRNVAEEFGKSQRKYSRTIERLFCYSVFIEEDCDVLEFNISYLKQHKNVHFRIR